MNLYRNVSLIFAQLCVALVIFTACVPPWYSEAALFLEDVAAENRDSRLKDRTPTPVITSIEYQISENNYHADLYLPGETPLAGIVLIPGVAEAGRGDTRLAAFAKTLARNRFIVLVPDIPSLRKLKVRAEDRLTISDAVTHLVSRPEFPEGAQIGIGAFSYAVGPALLAAMEPTVREKVHFILGVGGYYDLENVITFFTTGYFQHQNEWQYLEPNEYGKWVFVISNVDRLSDPNDQNIFLDIAKQKIENPDTQIDNLVANLTDEANSILNLLQNNNYEEAPKLLTKIPTAIRNDLDALNISNKDITRLKAKLILLHGTDDSIIPFTESIALSNAVGEDKTKLFLIEGLAHVDIHPKKLNKWAMLRAIDELLNVRDTKTASDRYIKHQPIVDRGPGDRGD